jgi:hypothetical protein
VVHYYLSALLPVILMGKHLFIFLTLPWFSIALAQEQEADNDIEQFSGIYQLGSKVYLRDDTSEADIKQYFCEKLSADL